MSENSPPIVAIDGPAASGKSTVARQVASSLGVVFVSSGGMYRAFTWWVLEKGIDPADTEAVIRLLAQTRFECGDNGGVGTIAVDGKLLTSSEISSEEVNRNVSIVAAVPEVRTRLVAEQRAYGEANGLVMEGRDIGSVVFPDTIYKYYIDASPEVREQRRRAEGITDSIAERDRLDSSRAASPLVIPDDAVVVDSSALTIKEVVDAVLESIAEKRKRA